MMAFSFGAPLANATAPSGGGGGFSFSAGGEPPKVGFNFGGVGGAATTATSAAAAPTTGEAPKAAMGFSFGAATSSAPTAVAPAPSTGGFGGFGLTAEGATTSSLVTPSSEPTTTSNKKKAPSGFSFGGGGAKKDDDGGKTTTDGGSAVTPAAKLGGGGGLFGTTTPGTTPAKAPSPVKTPNTVSGPAAVATTDTATPPAASQSTTTTAPKIIEPPPVEYQTLTVEQIINRFQAELETDAIAFLVEAQRVAHYDATLRDSQRSLSELTNMVSRLMLHQTDVNAQVQGIGSYQSELSKTLDVLERNVDELFAAQGNSHPLDADVEREKSYERAIDVDTKLDVMNTTLRHVVSDLNAAQERVWSSSLGVRVGGGGANDEVGKIIGVFNAHQETLAYLETKARSVEYDLAIIGEVLAKSGH
jgi:nuclear pore complex protein Nup62